ncbi:MAG: hypothetical protein AB7I36_13045 [Rhodospirillaceae bacterium]
MRTISPAWFYVTAAAIGMAATLPFVDWDGALVFDPDLRIDDILVYHAFFRSGALGVLTAPAPNVYFEGHSFLYGLALHLYQAVAGLIGLTPPLREAAIATVGIVGALAHIGATMVFCATARRLTQNGAAALLLTVLFGLSPQILNIDLIRIDRLMILPLVVVMHVSVLITRREAVTRDGLVLGAAMAALTATKISGVLFGVMPVLAASLVLLQDKASAWPRVRALTLSAIAAAIPVLTLLMIRHLLHWDRFAASLAEGYAMQMKWTSVLPSTPLLYYNIDLFAGYGAVFLILAAVSAAVLAARALVDRDATALWLLICLAMFSAAGMAVFKYDRGGYHLVPLYLYALAVMLRAAMDIAAGRIHIRRPLGEAFVALAILVLPLAALGDTYAAQTNEARLRDVSVEKTRVASRDWILAHFAPGERICMMTSSQWANPQLAGHGLQVTTAPLDIPYLDGAAMADYVAPHLYQLRAACDGLVLNDLHNTVYLNNFTTRGYADRRAEWDRLFTDLAQGYPPMVFEGPAKAFFVSRVEVYDLRPARTGLPARADMLAGTFDGAAFTFGARRVPVTKELTGAVDAVVRIDDGRVGAEGWAIDAARQEPAAAVVLVADDRVIGFGGTGTARRADVAAAYEAPDYQLAGYAVCAASNVDRVRVFALTHDGRAGELSAPEGAAISGAARRAPYPCLSFAEP